MAAQQPGGRHRQPGRHRAARRRGGPAVVAVMIVVVAIAAVAYVIEGRSGNHGGPVAARTMRATSSSSAPVAATPVAGSRVAPVGATSGPPPVLTHGGMWWGVDSSGPITRDSIQNVADWYRGARPQFWGRYLAGGYGLTRRELAFARAQHIYVYLIVNDRNCSGCAGGDACGNDRTGSQARDDAQAAIRRADRLGIPAGAVLYKDIEQVSSCSGEPSSDYLLGWYRAVSRTRYRTGLYGNTFRPFYDFPVGYCKAVAASARFAQDVVLDMNEPEPSLGAPRGTTGPLGAPHFAPFEPPCTPAGRTVIWQYGESIDRANVTDIDQARPGTHGFLAPDGSAT